MTVSSINGGAALLGVAPIKKVGAMEVKIKVKTLCSVVTSKGAADKGKTLDLPEVEATVLIAMGRAAAVKRKAPGNPDAT